MATYVQTPTIGSPIDTASFPGSHFEPIPSLGYSLSFKREHLHEDGFLNKQDMHDLEPYEYHPSRRLSIEHDMLSIFEDRALVDAIVTSLEFEQALLQPPSIPADEIATSFNKVCIRRPGTFLNKDGRWIKGKPCRVQNCDKRAQSNGLCKGHGGGARCSHQGCNKSSQGGGLCRAHGGGKRCSYLGCQKGTQRNGYCYLHGGVRSCSIEGCDKKDRGNGKCFSHGGGRRCQAPYCSTTLRRGTHCGKHVVRTV